MEKRCHAILTLSARWWSGIGLLSLSLVAGGCGTRQTPEQKLLGELANVGARLEYDDQQQAIFVNLADTEADNKTIAALPRLTHVTKLWVPDTNVTDGGLESIGQMKQLKYLVLSNTYVSNAGLQHLESLESLLELYLDGTRVTQAGAARLNEKLPNVSIVY